MEANFFLGLDRCREFWDSLHDGDFLGNGFSVERFGGERLSDRVSAGYRVNLWIGI